MKKINKKLTRFLAYFLALIGLIVVGVASWTVYQLANQGASDLLEIIGIKNVYFQGLIIILIAIIILFFLGTGIVKSVEKIVKG